MIKSELNKKRAKLVATIGLSLLLAQQVANVFGYNIDNVTDKIKPAIGTVVEILSLWSFI